MTGGKAAPDLSGPVVQDPSQHVSPGTGMMSDRLYPLPPPLPSCQQEASQWSLGPSEPMNQLRSPLPGPIGSDRRGSSIQISTRPEIIATPTSQSLSVAQYQLFGDQKGAPFRESDIAAHSSSGGPVSREPNFINNAPPPLRNIRALPEKFRLDDILVEKEGVARGISDNLESRTTAMPCKRPRSPDLVHDTHGEYQQQMIVSRKLRRTSHLSRLEGEFPATAETKEKSGGPTIHLLLERWIGSEGSAVVLNSDLD